MDTHANENGTPRNAVINALVVDDNEINLGVAQGLLDKFFHLSVDAALSGAEALEYARTKRYDIVFMDHMMPGMDGIETTERLRKLGGWCGKVPVIALTANAVAGAKEMLLGANMDDYLSKPVDRGDMAKVLERWLPGYSAPGVRMPVNDDDDDDAPRALADAARRIDGLDVSEGLKTVGDAETYEKSLRLLAGKIPGVADELAAHLAGGNMLLFSVHVHGMKSSLASVGAMRLSLLALELEQASLNSDSEKCARDLPEFLTRLRRFGAELSDIIASCDAASGAGASSRQGSTELLCEKLAALSQGLEEHDFDAVNHCMEELTRFDFGGSATSLIALLKEKVDSFDYDGAKGFIEFHFHDLF